MKSSERMVGGQEHFSYEKDPRELWLFSLKKRRVQGDLTARFQSPKEANRKVREGLLARPCSDRTKTNGFTPKYGRLTLDIKKN